MLIRKIEIYNFRSIQKLIWKPNEGINCLVGAGDLGKSTILDAIDWCLGSRRTLPITDADFYQLNVENPILIDITIGDLIDTLKTLDTYGMYLRSINDEGDIDDEPHQDAETVLTARLRICDDLDPSWSLVSERADSQGMSRNLSWGDRVRVAPTRIGAYASNHLSWNRTSLLMRVSEEKVDNSAALAEAARKARQTFGVSASDQLEETLGIVENVADELGVNYGDEITALLDAHSVSFSGGNISLHNDDGVPLKKLGLGSTRLLVAGLQKHVEQNSSIILVDEVEHGLEPHRIARLLTVLGAKNDDTETQVFMTTHSPVVLRELSSEQLNILRKEGAIHEVLNVGNEDALQGAIRHSAEAFLGSKVIVCEGATEVGLIRGLDLYRSDKDKKTLSALGGVLVDVGGISKIYRSASSFQALKYKVAVLRDDDKKPKQEDEDEFIKNGGMIFKWSDKYAIEDEIFACVSEGAAIKLLEFAIKVHGQDLIEKHIENIEQGSIELSDWLDELDEDKRDTLAEAAKLGSWFKRISIMEDAARYIIAPDLDEAHEDLRDVVKSIFEWGVDSDA